MRILLYGCCYTDIAIRMLLYDYCYTDTSIRVLLHRYCYTDCARWLLLYGYCLRIFIYSAYTSNRFAIPTYTRLIVFFYFVHISKSELLPVDEQYAYRDMRIEMRVKICVLTDAYRIAWESFAVD